MKTYANNEVLAGQLLETAFAILRNEGLQPVDCMEMVYGQLTEGIDVSDAHRASLRSYLREVVDGI